MSELLQGIDFQKIVFFLAPGVFIALLRSFAIKGSFPKLAQDDLGVLLIGSAVYNVVLLACGITLGSPDDLAGVTYETWLVWLVLVPSLAGFILGYIEANDWFGAFFRPFGLKVASPEATAWNTLFRELKLDSILFVHLKDGTVVYGRWRKNSISSTDTEKVDLFLDEIGELSTTGDYLPKHPQRGIYISPEEIRWIEVIQRS